MRLKFYLEDYIRTVSGIMLVTAIAQKCYSIYRIKTVKR